MSHTGFDEEDPTQLPEVGAAEALLHDQEWIEELAAEEEGKATVEEKTAIEQLELDVLSVDGEAPPNPTEGPNPFQYALESDWIMLFRNLCHAISHRAPWAYKFELDDAQKSQVMKKVITLFTTEFIVSAEEKNRVKAVLKEMRLHDPLDELQSLLISYKNNQNKIWGGHYDEYRNLRGDNFIDRRDYEAFKKQCNTQVTERVQAVQSALSDQETLRVETKAMWDDIHNTTSYNCFGGMIHIHVDCIEAVYDPADLPEKAYMSIEIQHGSIGYGEVELKRKLRRSEAHFDLLEDPGGEGSEPVALFVGSDLPPTEVQLVFRLRKQKNSGVFGCFADPQVAQWEIPAVTLYKSIEAFDSKVRRKDYADYFPGAHFVHLNVPDVGSEKLDLNVAIHLECRSAQHCVVPMTMDPRAPELSDQELADGMEERQARADEVWAVDHHKCAFKLLELFGDLQDDEYCAFQLYCDRYLVHQEFFDVGTLAVTATRKEFDDDMDRRHACAAVDRLMSMRGTITTRTCSGMTDKALDHARELCLARLLKLEMVVAGPADAELARVQAVFIIERTGLCAEDLVAHLANRVKQQADVTEKKLRKLAFFLSNEGKVGADSRMSVLIELEHTDRSLFAKVKVLHKLVKTVYRETNNAVDFAKKSGSSQVMLIALMRTQVAIDTIVPAMRNALVAVWTQLTLSKEAVNPLGSSLGIVAHLYKDTMQFVDTLATDHEDRMGECCSALSSCFDDFLVNWITLCQRKIMFWVETTIHQTALEPMDGAPYNTAAQDILQMFSEVFQFYFDCSQSGDPQMEQITIPKFCELLEQFSIHFIQRISSKAKASGTPFDEDAGNGEEGGEVSRGRRMLRNIKKGAKRITGWRKRSGSSIAQAVHDQPYSPSEADSFPERLGEWLTAICTMDVFSKKIGLFWNSKINSQLLSVTAGGGMEGEHVYDVDQVRAKTAAILAETKSGLFEGMEDFYTYVKARLFEYACQYLSVANTQACDMMAYTEALTADLDGALVLLGENTEGAFSLRKSVAFGSSSVATNEGSRGGSTVGGSPNNEVQQRVLMMAIRSFYAAFEARLFEQAKWPLRTDEKDIDLDIVTVLEDVVKRNTAYYNIDANKQLDHELLDLKRKTRHLIQLSGQTSKALVGSLNDRKSKATLSRAETEVLHSILQHRRDQDAENYWREHGQ